MNFHDDIPLQTAIAAHNGTSWTPEQRGEYERKSYAEGLAADYAALKELIADKPYLHATLDAEFERYRAGMRKHTLNYLYSRSRVVSAWIAGPSKFPAARMNKRADISHRRLNDLLEFRKRALKAIRRVLCPESHGIKSSDANAVELLQEKIDKAEHDQKRMKEANETIRRYKKAGADAQIGALIALGFPESMARKLLQPDFCGRIGFPDYELKNNNANIRRMRERLAVVSRNKATAATEVQCENAILNDDPPANRVRLFFKGKPEEKIRERLKSNGFRWTPSLGCWQAYRNHNAMTTARDIAGSATA